MSQTNYCRENRLQYYFSGMTRSMDRTYQLQIREKIDYGLTSPAPRKRNLWSGRVPPMSFRAATTPARTTDAVPYEKNALIIKRCKQI
jgi:hypothetical protein